MFWDFITLRPESTHQTMILFSDRGIPDGYRHMNGYGSHTFKLVNADGEAVYCKFHYKVFNEYLMILLYICTVSGKKCSTPLLTDKIKHVISSQFFRVCVWGKGI